MLTREPPTPPRDMKRQRRREHTSPRLTALQSVREGAAHTGANVGSPTTTFPARRHTSLRHEVLKWAAVDSRWRFAYPAADAILLSIAVWATVNWPGDGGVHGEIVWPLLCFPFVVLLLFAARGQYGGAMRTSLMDQVAPIFATAAIGTLVVTVSSVYVVQTTLEPGVGVHLWTLAVIFLLAGRIVLSLGLRAARRHDMLRASTLIIGAGVVGTKIAAPPAGAARVRAAARRLPGRRPAEGDAARSHGAGARNRRRSRRHRAPQRSHERRARLLDRERRLARLGRAPLPRTRPRGPARPAPVRVAERPHQLRAARRTADAGAQGDQPAQLGVQRQARLRPRGRRDRARHPRSAARAARAGGQAQLPGRHLLPAAARRPRRTRLRPAQVPLDGGAGPRRRPVRTGRRHRARRRRGRRSPHARSGASCAAPRSTSCRSCSTSCAAT